MERRVVDFEKALRTRVARSQEYRDQLLSVEAARISLRVAENGRQVELNANAGLAQNWVGSAWNRDWLLGLSLSHVLFDPAPDVARVNARLALEEAELALAKTEDTIRIDLRQRLRNLEVAWRRLELATRARELTARQLEIEREKLQAGRSASFQVVRFRNDLDDAANTELAASISYANEITQLDRALGVTLEVWGIDLEAEVARVSPEAAGARTSLNGGEGKRP